MIKLEIPAATFSHLLLEYSLARNTVKALGRSPAGSDFCTTRTSNRNWICRTTSGRQREAQHMASGAHMVKTYLLWVFWRISPKTRSMTHFPKCQEPPRGAQVGNASVVKVLVRFHEHDRSPELGNASVVAFLVRFHKHDKSQELGNASVVGVLLLLQ